MTKSYLPTLSSDSGLSKYLMEIRKFPMLTKSKEYQLAKRWKQHGDVKAAHALVTSHLRLVAKIAIGYRGYGLPINELIAEGNIGMMKAVKGFDPEKGFRLATYAMWWIKASIHEYILRSWSLVKIGTTAAQKKLFFNLKKMKNQIQQVDEDHLKPEQIKEISNRLDVSESDVVEMDQRLAGHDKSLNAKINNDSNSEWQDWVPDNKIDNALLLANKQELTQRRATLNEAMTHLDEREKDIINSRRLEDSPLTLKELSKRYNISRERIRQIESRAFKKLQSLMLEKKNDSS